MKKFFSYSCYTIHFDSLIMYTRNININESTLFCRLFHQMFDIYQGKYRDEYRILSW